MMAHEQVKGYTLTNHSSAHRQHPFPLLINTPSLEATMVRAAEVATTMAAALVVVIALSTTPAASAIDYTEHDLASEESLWALYERWCAHYNMARDLGEKTRRFNLFKENAHRIYEHNQGNATYTLGLNRFSDMTDEEFSRSPYGRCLFAPVQRISDGENEELQQHEDVSFNLTHGGATAALGLPPSVDWRGRSVTRVKDQGLTCGSCWAFAAIAAVEGINAIRTWSLVTLSEQQLVDCDNVDHGCAGGWIPSAFDFIVRNRGIVPEGTYPYIGTQGRCRHVMAPPVTIDGYRRVLPFDVNALMSAVAAQPVAVAMESSAWAFRHYQGGVFNGNCGGRLGHAAAVVGYGDGAGGPFWIVKNSWGPRWGEGGYVRISRNAPNRLGICGILTQPLYPVKR